MAMTQEQKTERAKKAAAARWAKSTPEKEREATLAKLRTLAHNLGYRLVPLAED